MHASLYHTAYSQSVCAAKPADQLETAQNGALPTRNQSALTPPPCAHTIFPPSSRRFPRGGQSRNGCGLSLQSVHVRCSCSACRCRPDRLRGAVCGSLLVVDVFRCSGGSRWKGRTVVKRTRDRRRRRKKRRKRTTKQQAGKHCGLAGRVMQQAAAPHSAVPCPPPTLALAGHSSRVAPAARPARPTTALRHSLPAPLSTTE